MAPLTAAERQRKRREKLKKDGQYEEYKKKHSLLMKKHRQVKADKVSKLPVAVQKELKELEKKKVRERVAKCRRNKSVKQPAENKSSPCKIYKSTSALGKAVARARRALPNSPRHKEIVVRKLFSSECNIDLTTSFNSSKSTSNHANAINSDTKIKIEEFYERDDISRMAPGRKDVVTIWERGAKIKQQARHLICTINEIYIMFKIENPSAVVGKSKFFELRPKHILLSSKLPHNVCLCIYHENFINAVNVLHQHNDAVPNYSYAFPEEIICVPASRNCWMNECQDSGAGVTDKNAKKTDSDNASAENYNVNNRDLFID
ncbi:hypothetical protein JTE90_020890 [Oedothorax gibbosus]|uniref:Uncharacterized protein n=1 Tax=Oedothorax gibbosus TaxID=931172 RepID=A0AAV6U9A2_9ARAC|nr:hypothetical protein JTE90_020890 [Oedothorax gibbosus]